MSRAIKLTRIHAINWYGYNDSLPVEGNLLLAGVTGSGKSVLMDLIMTVLVGTDAAHHHFNRSATGGQSDRTVKGYCLLDTKREENGVPQYIRPAAITYIALEFSWPRKATEEARIETWGLRIEFRNTAENQGHVKPFVVYGPLTKADFLNAERRPLEAAEFKHLVEKARDGKLFETQEQYLRDMAIDQHLNFNRAVLSSLLPQAMSFTNLKSFDEFCRRFILPDDKLNVADVVASYRNFKAYENDLRVLFDQQRRLEAIRDLHRDQTTAVRDRIIARWIGSELTRDHASALVRGREDKLKGVKAEFAKEEARISELGEWIRKAQTEHQQLQALIGQSSEGQLYLFLKARNSEMAREIERLRGIGSSVETALRNRVKKARQWLDEVAAAPLPEAVGTSAFAAAIKHLDGCAANDTDSALAELAKEAEQLKMALSRAIRPFSKDLDDLRVRKGQLKEEVTLLESGQLPFPTVLLNALNESLPWEGRMPPAQPLCKLCEVTDEKWRPAIEVAFTRKFAVVVSEDNYQPAVKIYRALKTDAEKDIQRESLVNPRKVRGKTVLPGSLAEKLSSEHPVARALVSQLFGDLICVESLDELNDPKVDRGILSDGFMSSGPFVDRRRHYDGLPFVGQRGLERQLTLKRGEVKQIEAEERRLSPVVLAVQSINDRANQFVPEHASLAKDVFEAQGLPKLEEELRQNIAKLNSIDRASFEEKEQQLVSISKQLDVWQPERDGLLRSQKKGEIDRLEVELSKAKSAESAATASFERVKEECGDISMHAIRLGAWRAEIRFIREVCI